MLNMQLAEELKEKAVIFISANRTAKTNQVAKHLGIPKEKAFDLLLEMLNVTNP